MSAKPKSKKVLAKAKWLQLVELEYEDEKGHVRKWESCERTTTTKLGVDGVDIIATFKKMGENDKMIIIKQYRPPVEKYSLEFPAGLVDEKETPEKTALKELREETGYIGKVLKVGELLAMEPGLTKANCKMVIMEVDGDKKENIKPEQELEETENIEVLLIEKDKLYSTLQKYSKEGCIIDAKLWTFSFCLNCMCRKK